MDKRKTTDRQFAGDTLARPIFTLSLDLELAWGFVLHPEHPTSALLQRNPQQAREAVDWLLNVLERYDIRATWAVVGHLFLSPGEGEGLVSREIPQFSEGWLDWGFYSNLKSHPLLYYGRDVVERILSSPAKQEIGLHGFFHIPFDQCSYEVASAEVEMGLRAANKLGISPKSFVFPENSIGHVDILKNYRFKIYRGSTSRRWGKDKRPLIGLFDSAVDKIIATPVSPSYNANGVWEIPGSALFCDRNFPFTLPWRSRLGLYRTILTKKVFHIWLHPRNLLMYERLADDLEKFLALVARRRDEGKIEVMTMSELADRMDKQCGNSSSLTRQLSDATD